MTKADLGILGKGDFLARNPLQDHVELDESCLVVNM